MPTPNIHSPILSFLALLFITHFPYLSCSAQHRIDIVKPGDVIEIRLPVLKGAAGAEATRILTSDLQRSGWFKIVATGGEYAIEGSASGSQVDCQVSKGGSKDFDASGSSGTLRRAVHEVADKIVEKITGRPGMARSRIAFISNKSGKKELYVMDYDGENVKRCTQDGSLVVSPAFNKQGTRIAFTTYKSAFPDVHVMEFPAGGRKVVARYPGLNSGAAFSPDGSKLALTVSKDGNPELYVMSSSGSGLKRLTKTKKGESSPSWSPDGSEIVYSSDESGRPHLYIMSSSGGSPRKLTSSPAYNTEPDWSAENGLIAYTTQSGGFQISVIDPKTGKRQTVYSDGNCEDPSWAPNGRHIVFTRSAGGKSNLYVLDYVTREAIQLTRDFGSCTEPSWSGR
jgi:TolB protein